MQQRSLGKTGLMVGKIGLGTEHLVIPSRNEVTAIVHEAMDQGVNYFDILWPMAEYRDKLGAALKGRREDAILAGHIGVIEQNGQPKRFRGVAESRSFFDDLLRRLQTDYLDVAFIQHVDEEADYEAILAPGGLLDMARGLQEAGKIRFLGISGHRVALMHKAVESGLFDVIMHQVNLSSDATPGRRALYQTCKRLGVGLVAMKPFAGGGLLRSDSSYGVTPVRCLSYSLAQTGVSTVVPGVRSVAELQEALAWLEAPDDERDFASLLPHFQEGLEGICQYCNHCLPCVLGIDIGRTLQLLDAAKAGVTDALRADYEALPAKPSLCIECGNCMARCPFGVNVIARLNEVALLFEDR